ncbi:MAG: hypothetical protein IJ057_06335 [Bacteroidales bacterium]|nr:hypothetical protein [Bacteroidales bacterium]
MSALFIILSIIRIAQQLLVLAYSFGYHWCLTAFVVVTALLFVADLVIFITIHTTTKELERREP